MKFTSFSFLMVVVALGYSQINRSMEAGKMKVEIWSDVVCPFCYIGKQKLEKALISTGLSDKVEVIWHSFQLDPNFPQGISQNSTEYLGKTKGWSKSDMVQIYEQLSRSARPYGIDFQFEKSLSFNTSKAHVLLHWSKRFAKQNELKLALFKAYFTNGIDLSKEENLLSVCAEIGLDSVEAKKALSDKSLEQLVNDDLLDARRIGIRGVPYFLVGGSQTISGAVDDSVFERTLKKAYQSHTENQSQIQEQLNGAVCDPKGNCE